MNMSHEIHSVKAFRIAGDYSLTITFDDESQQTINFEPLLRGELYGPLRDLDFFNRVRLDEETGTIVWPNGADFDPATLHDWDTVGPNMIALAQTWDDVKETSSSH
jgi:hypothetical protein